MIDRMRTRAKQRSILQLERLEDRRLMAVNFLPGDTAMSQAVNAQKQVAIEPGGSGYLAVWTDERAVLSGFVNTTSPLNGNGQDIYGQLLDAGGLPIGSPIVIANAGHNQSDPDIAWNASANAWLVVFESQDPEWYFHDQVYGVRVSATGDLLNASPQLIFEQDGNQGIFDVDVASDGSSWAVVATKFHGVPLEGSIIGRRISADGSVLDPQPKVFLQGDLMMPDIAYADGVYLLAAKNRVSNQIYVTPTNTLLNAIGPSILVGSGDFSGPRVASNGTGFMVVGQRGYRVDASGQVLDSAGIVLGGTTTSSTKRDVAWNGEMWSVGMRTFSGDIAMQRISSDGQLVDAEPQIVVADVVDEQVAVAATGGQTVILVSDRPGSDQDIRGVRFDSQGVASGLIDVSVGLGRQSRVAAADGPADENLVVYLRQVSGESRILSQRIRDDGTIIDAEPTVVGINSSNLGVSPKVAWNGTNYLVTWANFAVRLSSANLVLDLQPIVVSANTHYVRTVSAAGATFITAITERVSVPGPSNIWFVRIGDDGVVMDPSPRFIDIGSPSEMTSDSFGESVVFGWGLSSTKAAIIHADATIIGPIIVSNGRGQSPQVAVQGNQALFVYADNEISGNDNIEGRFLYSDGSLPEWEFPISREPRQQTSPSVAWIGNQYVVAWSDYRHIEGIQQLRADIRGARVTVDGIVREPKGFTVTQSAIPEDMPTVIGGSGHSWILFSALHELNGSPAVQRIGFQYGPIIDYNLAPFDRVGIPGGFSAVSAGNSGVLAELNEVHRFDVDLAPGETVTAFIHPGNPDALLSGQFAGHGSTVTSTTPGAQIVVPLVSLPEGGRLTLEIQSSVPTSYQFDLRRNQNLMSLVETAQAVSIDDAALPLGRNAQYAAIGQAHGQEGGAGFHHYHDASLFVDISTTGTPLVLDDGFYGNRAYVTTTIGNELLPAGTVTVARDGVVTPGFHDIYLGANQTIPDAFYLGDHLALAPYWALLGANDSTGLGQGAVYLQERQVNGIDTLIIQWHNIPAWHNLGAGTFQVQVFASGPVKSRFVYQDVTFGDPNVDGGRTASIGLQLDGNTGHQFSFRTPSVMAGDVIDFMDLPTVEDIDDMNVSLVAGESVDLAISGVDVPFSSTEMVELLDSGGNLLATGSAVYNGNPIGNFDQGILGFVVPFDGIYTVRVRSTRSIQYELLVTRELAIELESDAPSAIRSLDGTTGAFGSLSDRPALSGYSHYQDPSLFVDISQTGSALFFDHGDGVAPIYTNIGNALMPAGKFLVGNDGALMLDEDLDAFSGDSHQMLPSFAFEFSALVPYWTDLDDSQGAVYFEERVIDGIDTLIVQWQDRSVFLGSEGGTFQVQLFDRGPSAARQLAARFVYLDVEFGDPLLDHGADATIGVQLDRSSAQVVSHNMAAISNGDVIDIYIELGDRFPMELQAGEVVTLHTLTPLDEVNIVPANRLDPGIAVLDANGNILASDSNSVDGKNAGLVFVAPLQGTYRIAVYSEENAGEYVIQTTPGESLRDGDFDNNSQYDVADLDSLMQRILRYSQDPVYDLTGDRRVTFTDLEEWLSEAGRNNLPSQAPFLAGDANLDGFVDGSDFNIWNANKFRTTGLWSQGDFNADGVTDGSDFNIWNANKFQASGLRSGSLDMDRQHRLVDRIFADIESQVDSKLANSYFQRGRKITARFLCTALVVSFQPSVISEV
jgi:hypothetical protein